PSPHCTRRDRTSTRLRRQVFSHRPPGGARLQPDRNTYSHGFGSRTTKNGIRPPETPLTAQSSKISAVCILNSGSGIRDPGSGDPGSGSESLAPEAPFSVLGYV